MSQILDFHSSFRSIANKSVIEPRLGMINQLKEGLVVCGLLEAIQKDPELFKPLFMPSDLFTVTSEEFLEELQVVFSEKQVEKMAKEVTFKHFCDLVEHLHHIGKYEKYLKNNIFIKGLCTVYF